MSINTVRQIDDLVDVRNVLVSVSDKSGLDVLIPKLVKTIPAVRIFSTGGTYQAIRDILGEASAERLVQVSAYTGQPEMQGGLVKTLDFKIYLGLLSETYNEEHQKDMARTGAVPIDMVVVNLYPFQKTVERPDATPESARGNIDIGGPCMVRAAAKNFIRVASVTDPRDYVRILRELRRRKGRLSLDTRFRLAKKAFAHTAAYDRAISKYWRQCEVDQVRAVYEIRNPAEDHHV